MKIVKNILNIMCVVFLISTQFNFLLAQENLQPDPIEPSDVTITDSWTVQENLPLDPIISWETTNINLEISSWVVQENLPIPQVETILTQPDLNLPVPQENIVESKQTDLSPKLENNISNTQENNYVWWEILVKFKTSKINLKSAWWKVSSVIFANNKDLEKVDTIENSNIAVMEIQWTETVEQKIIQLQSDVNVEYAEPNYIYSTMSMSFNDPYSGNLRALSKIHRYETYDMFSGNINTTGTIVAVLDAWVAYNHPDLSANMRNGSGCKDNAWQTLNNCVYGYDFADNDLNPFPVRSDHGTHVAGTIAAAANNGSWIIWINPHAQIMAVRVGDDSMTLEDIIKWIDFARYNWAKIINASFGWIWYSTWMYDAINSFRSAWWLFIAAAGNGDNYWTYSGDNHDTPSQHVYPCDYNLDNIICVAATDVSDGIASFSDYGLTSVDVWAPWVNIYSTIFQKDTLTWMRDDLESYATWSIPSGWTSWWIQNNRWIYDSQKSWREKVLYSDLDYPYANNTDSYVDKSLDLSIYSGATISFWTRCDTEYDISNRTDYMSLEITTWWTYVPLSISEIWYAGRDEATLDNDYDANNNVNSWVAMPLSANIPWAYLSNNFKVRFRWTTNSSDNNYNWCLIDDVRIDWYNPSSSIENYGYKDGTSMATPNVAWLASLAWSASPSSAYSQIRNIIINSGDAVSSLSWKTVSGRRINAQNVLLALWYGSWSSESIFTWTNRAQIYTTIWQSLSGQWILNNLNTVTTWNANIFSWLYFAKMIWSDEVWRITFYTWIDLTDTWTQNFISWSLINSIWIQQWKIRFNPGTWFVSKNATIKMNLPYSLYPLFWSINSWSFIVRTTSGGAVTWNSMITSVYSWACVWISNYACPIYLNVSHFTQFELKPFISTTIKSTNNTNTSYAKSWDIVTVVFTWSETLTGISVLINGIANTITGSWVSRYSNFIVTWWTAQTWISFSISYQDLDGNTWSIATTTTDSSSVKVDTTNPLIKVTSANTSVWANYTAQWTWYDNIWLYRIYVNWYIASGTGSWSQSAIALTSWVNTIYITGMDNAGNTIYTGFTVTRLQSLSSVTSEVLSWTSARIVFSTDLLSSWYVIYGTTSLNTIVAWTLATSHNIILNGLTHNTTYYYRAYTMLNGITWDMSATGTFVLPYVIPTNGSSDITTTWTVDLWWWLSTNFTTHWLLRVFGSWSTQNYFEVDLDGLWVLSDSWSWNGLVFGPIWTWFKWTVPSYTDYTHQPTLTFKIWAENVWITFSWQIVTVRMYVWTTYNNDLLRIYRSATWTTYSKIDTCRVSNGYCIFDTETFSYFTIMSPVLGTSNSSSNTSSTNGVPTCKSSDLICVNWSYEIDGNIDCDWWKLWDTCDGTDHNIDQWDITWSPFSAELNDAYQYAYSIWITSMSTIKAANMTWTLQRSHLAKMIVNYATDVLNMEPDTSKTCNFTDIDSQNTEIKWYIKTACQMWLMWVGLKTFYPKNKVTIAEFGTILSRALWWTDNNQAWANYYSKHLNALKYNWIMTNISNPWSIEKRWYVMLMMMRAKDI